MAETLLSLRTELKKQLGNRTDVADDRYNRWINTALVDLSEELTTDDFESSSPIITISGTNLYSLPPDVEVVRSVSAIDSTDTIYGGYPLAQMDLRFYRQQAIESGAPEFWFIFNRQLLLWPTPDAAYTLTLDSSITVAELTADTSVVNLRPGVQSILLLRARWVAQDALGMSAEALLTQQQYATQVKMRVDRRAQQQQGRNLRVSVPRTDRQLRMGYRGYLDGIRRSS